MRNLLADIIDIILFGSAEGNSIDGKRITSAIVEAIREIA